MKITKEKAMLAVRLLLIMAILVTVGFIFSNSMKTKTESSEQSSAVGGIIAEIIPPDTSLGAMIQKNLRKIAHFTEFGLLGIEAALYVILFKKKRWVRWAFFSVIFAFLVGFADETIQIFYDRGPSVSDVWIDVGGFCFFSSLFYLGLFALIYGARLVIYLRSKSKQRAETEETNG